MKRKFYHLRQMGYFIRTLLFFIGIFAAGCQTQKVLPSSDFQFFLEQGKESQDLIWSSTATMPISNLQLNICAQPIFLASDIDFARVASSNFGKCILFQLTQRAAINFYKLSVEGSGRKIIFVFNGKPLGLSMPMTQTSLDGNFAIFPEIEDDQLDGLVKDLSDTIAKLKKLKKD